LFYFIVISGRAHLNIAANAMANLRK